MNPAEAERKYRQVLKKISGPTKIKTSIGLTRLTHKIMMDGIKNQFPDINQTELKKQIFIRTSK